MRNINDILRIAKKRLGDAGVVGADSDAEFLFAHILGVSRSQLKFYGEASGEQEARFNDLIARRLSHEPMDSLIGYTEYLGLKIPFNKAVLTPRQETEIMTDNIINEYKGKENLEILDLCCGSGCIGLALSKHLGATTTLADISDEAVDIARGNAELNHIKCDIIVSNLFDNVTGQFDIIVSNPPYIPTSDLLSLEDEVKFYDPRIALDGGQDGLDFYVKIIDSAPKYLKDNGRIYLEFGINQAEDIYNLMQENFKDITIYRDYSGIERYIKGIKK